MSLWRRFSIKESNGLVKSILTLVAGNAAAKAIGLAAMPVITRLYSPAEMGVLSSYIAVLAILAPMVTLRYVTVLPVPRTRLVATNLLALNVALLLLMTGLLAGLASWRGREILVFFSFPLLEPFLALVVVGVFLSGLYEVLSMWAARHRNYRALAASQAWQGLLGNALKVGLGFLSWKTNGLILGQVAQSAGGSLRLLKQCCHELWFSRRSIKVSRLWRVAKGFKDVPQYRLPSHAFLMLSMQGPLLVTTYLYGVEDGGQLGLALSALALPLNVLGAAAGNAYFSEVSALGRGESKKIHALTKALVKRLCILAVPPALVLMATGPWLFSLVFGAEWEKSGEFARVLSIYLVFQFISSPLGNVLALYRRQELFFKMNLFRFIMVVAVFYLSSLWALDSLTAILTYSLALSVHYYLSNRVIMRVIKDAAGVEK